MAEGQEIRGVVEGQNISASANQPSRQLGQVGVQAPRGGRTQSAGESVLGEALKMGSKALDSYVARKKAEDVINGEIDFAQGKTEAELVNAGASPARLQSYRMLDVKATHDKWVSHTLATMDDAMSPEDFGNELKAQSKSVLDGIDPDDPASKDLMAMSASLLNNSNSKLAATHMERFTVASMGRASQSVTSMFYNSAGSDTPEERAEMFAGRHDLATGISNEAVDSAYATATIQSLKDGNFTLLDDAGGMQGLRDIGLSFGQMDSLKSAHKTAQAMSANTNAAEINGMTRAIEEDFGDGTTGPAEYQERITAMGEQFRLDPGRIASYLNSASANIADKEEFAEHIDVLADDEFQSDFNFAIQKIEAGGALSAGIADVREIGKKYNIPEDILQGYMLETEAARDTYNNKVQSNTDSLIAEQKKLRKQESDAIGLIGSKDWYNPANQTATVQKGLQMAGQSIHAQLENEGMEPGDEMQVEFANRHAEFLKDKPVNERLAGSMQSVSNFEAAMPDGTINPSHLDALTSYRAMRDVGMSADTLSKYAGDADTYLNMVADFVDGGTDPTIAAISSWEQLRASEEGVLVKPKADVNKMMKSWGTGSHHGKKKRKFYDTFNPSMLDSILGNGGQYDEVLTKELKSAMKNSDSVDNFLRQRLAQNARLFPNANEEAVFNETKRELKDIDYVMGNVILPHNGVSLRDSMGLGGTQAKMAPNSAYILYLRDHLDATFPDNVEVRAGWEHITGGLKDVVETVIFQPETISNSLKSTGRTNIPTDLGVGAMNLLSKSPVDPLAFFERNQQLKNKMRAVDIQQIGDQSIITLYATNKRDQILGKANVPNRDIGEYFTNMKTEKLRERALTSNKGK